MKSIVTISNAHPKGFAFGITDEGEQVFIPPHVVDDKSLLLGEEYEVVAVTNPDQIHRERTPWIAVAFTIDIESRDVKAVDEAQAALYETAADRDEAVYEYICDNSYVTSGELGQHIGTNARTAANSAMRLFNAGRIAKADVYNRVGQQRSTMTLWATSAADFVDGEDQ